jgi:hypothetical protein
VIFTMANHAVRDSARVFNPPDPVDLLELVAALDCAVESACTILAAFDGLTHSHACTDDTERRQQRGIAALLEALIGRLLVIQDGLSALLCANPGDASNV